MNKLKLIFTTLLLAPVAALNAADAPTATPRNMLFIITDQQTVGALSCAGNPYMKTPDMAHTAASICSPTRYSLMTGRYPWWSAWRIGVLKARRPVPDHARHAHVTGNVAVGGLSDGDRRQMAHG